MSAVPPCYQGKPGVPTMEEVRGGVTKALEAEGFLLSAKNPLVAVEAEPLVVFPGGVTARRTVATAPKGDEDDPVG